MLHKGLPRRHSDHLKAENLQAAFGLWWMHSFQRLCSLEMIWIIIVPFKVQECLWKTERMQQKNGSKCCSQTNLAAEKWPLQIVARSWSLFTHPCIFKQLSLTHGPKKGLRCMQCKWPSQRCCLNVLDCHCERFSEHDYERPALLRARNVRRRLFLRLLSLPHPRSMQLMLKATILAILQSPSVCPSENATKSQKSKKNAAQPGLEPEKWSKKRSQKRGAWNATTP